MRKVALPLTYCCIGVLCLSLVPNRTTGQTADPPAPPSLKTVAVRQPPDLDDYVQDKQLAIVLGKALFWDMQVGSDGIVACATCHFNAGADSRSVNQISPAQRRVSATYQADPDRTIDRGANYQLKADDFPFHKLANPNDRASAVVSDSSDIAGSQGVFNTEFVASNSGNAVDVTRLIPDPDGFQVGGVNVRRVVARNAPSVINAVFNFRSFWDGRAQNVFNGVNHLGESDPDARVYRADNPFQLREVQVRIVNAALASQAVAPPLNSSEQGSAGRDFSDIAQRFSFQLKVGSRRLLGLRPLGKQLVSKDDSVLGRYSRYPKPGLVFENYQQMIAAVFRSQWWLSTSYIHVNPDGTRTIKPIVLFPGDGDLLQIQYNFSLFFGLAVQMYEATLISNDTPFDRYRDGNASAMTEQQKQGLALFLSQTRGRCINCHTGPELTEASYSIAGVNRIRRREGQLIDTGYFNIGIRPHLEDLGIGSTDGTSGDQSLSLARRAMRGQFYDEALSPPLSPADVLAVDGAFKVPGLRNVELTAPYFHNGSHATLEGVIDFYSRGGDFVPIQGREGVITPVRTLNLSATEKAALVAFLMALTDERVRRQQAPFDHPQLFVPNGAEGNTTRVRPDSNGAAEDRLLEIKEVGREGGPPLKKFLK